MADPSVILVVCMLAICSIQATQQNTSSTIELPDILRTVKLSGGEGIYTLPIDEILLDDVSQPWLHVPMPTHSFFAGFEPPRDSQRWKIAQAQASRGEQTLLQRVLKVIHSPKDLHERELKFDWIHELSDIKLSRSDSVSHKIKGFREYRAPLVQFGYHTKGEKGMEFLHTSLSSQYLIGALRDGSARFPRKIVGIGDMDENFGWLSTIFLNRTSDWRMSLYGSSNPTASFYRPPQQQVQPLLDDPNLIALIVNQHHNMTHPKVISIPLGVVHPDEVFKAMRTAARFGVIKSKHVFSATSDFAFRPAVRACVQDKMGSLLEGTPGKLKRMEYKMHLLASRAVLSLPGVGYDCYRVWEALAAGAMPILEKSTGLDRSLYKLPALLLEDFAELTPDIYMQAYVEALYRCDEWEYSRITRSYWAGLIHDISEKSSIQPLMDLHPMIAVDASFTRPLIPFDCAAMGGCGNGTLRTPRRSCGIDPSLMRSRSADGSERVTYNFYWLRDRRRKREEQAAALAMEKKKKKRLEELQAHRSSKAVPAQGLSGTSL